MLSTHIETIVDVCGTDSLPCYLQVTISLQLSVCEQPALSVLVQTQYVSFNFSHLCSPSSQHCSLPSLSILCSRLHMEDVCNAVLLVWSSLRLTPIRSFTLQWYQLKNYLINPDWLALVLAEEHFHHLGVGTTKHQGETGIRNIVRFSTCVILIIKQTTEWPGQWVQQMFWPTFSLGL